MGHGGREDGAGLQGVHQMLQGHGLGVAAGQSGPEQTLFLFHRLNCKGNRLSNTGENGNLPGISLGDAQSRFLPWNIACKGT